MTFGKYTVDYEQRIFNPERMRKYRLERAHAALKKYSLGAMVTFNFDTFRYLGYYSTHNYARRRPGMFLVLVQDAGYPYVPADMIAPKSDEELMPWLSGKFKLRTSMMNTIYQGYPQQPDYALGHWTKVAEEIKGLLNDHKVADLPVGIDMTGLNMIRACDKAGLKMVDGNVAMVDARMIKNEDEIECLRLAGACTESAHWEVCKALRPGVTESQMAGVAAKAVLDQGCDDLEGPSFVVCSGERSGHGGWVPAMWTDRVIRPGDMFVIDINGVSFNGYRTCFYRTYCVGDKPTEFQKDIYQAAYDAEMALTNSIKPGISNHDVTKAFREKGIGRWFNGAKWPNPGKYWMGGGCHHIGQCSGDPGPGIAASIGVDPSSNDVLNPSSAPPLTLEKGMCFAVEIGCHNWEGNKWSKDGCKLEHCGVVTDTGFEVFYRFPMKDLIAVGLPGTY